MKDMSAGALSTTVPIGPARIAVSWTPSSPAEMLIAGLGSFLLAAMKRPPKVTVSSFGTINSTKGYAVAGVILIGLAGLAAFMASKAEK